MKLLTLENWPVLVVCLGMLAAAVIDWWKFKVPNKLTFPLIISGWVLGLANNFGLEAGQGGVGAAHVKMTMGFGSWIGAFFGLGQGLWIIAYAFCAGTIVGGVIALGMI